MNLRGTEWLIILAVVVLLFGAKKLPEAARGLGRSLRIFRSEVKGMQDDDKSATRAAELHRAERGPQDVEESRPGDAEPRETR